MKTKVERRFLISISIGIMSLLASACTSTPANVPTQQATPVASPTATQAKEASPTLPPDEAATRLHVPDGFTLNTYFSGLYTPRLMTIGPDGLLYVAEQGAGAVIRLPDANGDGVADERQEVADGINQPNNMEWHDGSLYVATGNRILRFTDHNGDGDMLDAGEKEVVTNQLPITGDHFTRTLHFGPDGKLYVTAGSTTNIEIESDRRHGSIMRFNPDGSIPADNPFAQDPDEKRRAVWAEGLRNSVDFLFLPDGRLWADHNGSDELGDDVPPEEVIIEIQKGKHYGWPYCYTPILGVVPPDTVDAHDQRMPFDDRLSDCSQATPALFTDLAHQAPLGTALYNKSAFPAEYQGSIFIAYHGSWNSTQTRDCKVQQIVVKDGKPVDSRPFVTGFRDSQDQQCGSAWGRPAGVAVGIHGELFISDDQNGNIYRVVYNGK